MGIEPLPHAREAVDAREAHLLELGAGARLRRSRSEVVASRCRYARSRRGGREEELLHRTGERDLAPALEIDCGGSPRQTQRRCERARAGIRGSPALAASSRAASPQAPPGSVSNMMSRTRLRERWSSEVRRDRVLATRLMSSMERYSHTTSMTLTSYARGVVGRFQPRLYHAEHLRPEKDRHSDERLVRGHEMGCAACVTGEHRYRRTSRSALPPPPRPRESR